MKNYQGIKEHKSKYLIFFYVNLKGVDSTEKHVYYVSIYILS